MRHIFRRGSWMTLFAVVLALGLAACGGDDDDGSGDSGGGAYGGGAATTEETTTETTTEETTGGGAAPKAAKVEIKDFAFDPSTITIQVGGKVNWANEDAAPHTATADDGSFDTGEIEQDKRGNATFKEAGTFPYFCEIHPDMRGTVEVVE
jgi:plastocyanin